MAVFANCVLQNHGRLWLIRLVSKNKMLNNELLTQNIETDASTATLSDLLRLGKEAYEQNHYETALDCFTKALKLKTPDSEIYIDLGSSLYGLKRYNEAEENLRKAIDIDPQHVMSYKVLAQFYKFTNQPDLSIPLFEKFIELTVTFTPGKISALKHVAEMYADKNEYQKAEALYRQLLSYEPANVDYQIDVARVLCMQNAFPKALEILMPLTETENVRNRSFVFYMLGKIHRETYDYRPAVDYLKKHMTLSPHSYNGFRELSFAYTGIDKDSKALHAL